MNITREDLPERQVALTIELESAEVEPVLQKAYRQLVGKVNVPGFRPGKAPYRIFERFVGRDALIEHASEALVQTTLADALVEQGIEASDIADMELQSTDPVRLRLVVDRPAHIELGDYSDIRVEREPAELADDAVETVITNLRRREGTWAAPAEERAAQVGDRVVVDMETFTIEGPVRNMTGEDLSMELTAVSPATWPAEIDANIVGLSPGEEKDFAITFPPGYPDEDLREKDATVHVRLKSLEELTLPDMDEAFTQKVAQLDTVDELRTRVEENLRQEAEQNAESKQVDEVIRQLVERATVEVPKAMIDHEIDHRFTDLTASLRERHVDPRRYFSLTGSSEAEWRAAQRETARTRLRQTLVLGEVARREKLATVSPAEVEAALDERMQPYVGTESEGPIREIFGAPEQRERIENEIFERRLIERLVAIAEGRAVAATLDNADNGDDMNDAADTTADDSTDADDSITADITAAYDNTADDSDSSTAAASDDTDSTLTTHAPEISGAIPATEQEPGPLETAGGAAEVLGAGARTPEHLEGLQTTEHTKED